MNKLFTLLAFFSFFTTAFAQQDFRKGYIITAQDTLKGLVDYRGDKRNALLCAFKTDHKAPIQKFSPAQLTGYGFEQGKRYEAHTLPGTGKSTVFLQVLVKGPASLYAHRDTTSRDRFYLTMGDSLQEMKENFRYEKDKQGRLIKFSDLHYRKKLAANFRACSTLFSQIQQTRLKGSALINTVAAYNRCVNQDEPFYVQPLARSRFTGGVVAGLNYAALKLTGFSYWNNPEGFTSSTQPQAGVYGNLTLPRVNEKLSLQGELLVTKNKFTANFTQAGNFGRVNHYDLLFDLTYVKAPVQVRYTFPVGRNRPFLNVGVMNGYAVGVKQESVMNSTLGSTSYNETKPAVENFRKYSQGFTGGFGWQFARRENKVMLLELRYESSNGFSNATAVKSAINSIYLNFGYQL